MESEEFRVVRISAKEIVKRFKLEGVILGFATPTRQEVSELSDKVLVVRLKK